MSPLCQPAPSAADLDFVLASSHSTSSTPPKCGRFQPRKSNASTPAPNDEPVSPADSRISFPASAIPDPLRANSQLLVEKLSYADAPRPWKNPNFVSALPSRTASGATAAGFKRNAKQLLTLERERIGGGDGFLSAAQTAAKARGEPIEPVKKKKKENPIGKPRSSLKGRRSGVATPMTIDDSEMSGTATPMEVDEDEEGEMLEDRGEVITYHTPTAPPSLLPAKKYCDITGLHGPYTDPRTKLRYKGVEMWNIVRNLGPGVDQAYLALRGAQTSLK
ncbi:hypothetical protein A1Q2_02197 [Trichosporon asahii var. asahii CBS 8904]|uniref:Vps72/YL1 C-terminal domain-containing protein n=1 Tax=Trichosporon asahii var. asahii (strain CBS 8904) TaxID=1220162 RepID=K1WR09_TRIAC|nr:hypothetical protein A1Q2_02197 [Trichosporon asahii var. asahii CBS 8904]